MNILKQRTLLITGLLLAITSCKKNSDTTPSPPPVLPIINSFSPMTGSAGTTVTINGKNFSPTIANDIVSFNGTAATVTSATADQIIATLPNDAATGKIVVKIASNTAASADNFNVTLNQLSIVQYEIYPILAAGTGNKIVFVGDGNLVDVYDANTNTWDITNMPLSFGTTVNFQIAATANKILFTSNTKNTGTQVYDVSTNSWSFMQEGISEQRDQMAAAVTGDKILFAGGLILPGAPPTLSKTVDIYDVSTNNWSTAQLSEARMSLAAAAAGNKVLFAGGYDGSGYSKTVDIYDAATNSWSTAQLSEARSGVVAAAAGNKVLFAGGYYVNGTWSKTVDIYDAVANKWSTAQLSEARGGLGAAAAGNKVLFAGGWNGTLSKTVDMYDVVTGKWSTAELSNERHSLAGASAGDKIVFGGGIQYAGDGLQAKTVDIYDVQTGMWYH